MARTEWFDAFRRLVDRRFRRDKRLKMLDQKIAENISFILP